MKKIKTMDEILKEMSKPNVWDKKSRYERCSYWYRIAIYYLNKIDVRDKDTIRLCVNALYKRYVKNDETDIPAEGYFFTVMRGMFMLEMTLDGYLNVEDEIIIHIIYLLKYKIEAIKSILTCEKVKSEDGEIKTIHHYEEIFDMKEHRDWYKFLLAIFILREEWIDGKE